jgi:4-amino-4-deoxy-L-arabinose transferase-like glycosyltransferase
LIFKQYLTHFHFVNLNRIPSIESILNRKFLHYILLVILIYFIAFFKLGNFAFRFWDESMFAVNAYEMAENGNYMVPYFDGQVDWRNSKPLLLTWIQVGLIKTVGFSELTIRLPSACAVLFSILMLFSFLRKEVNLLFAWIASLILLTSPGYITWHTGRTGDADSLLSFLLLGFFIYWAKWALDKKGKNVLMAFLFLSLAVLCKSFAALIFIPPVVLFTFIYLRKEVFREVFKSTAFYGGSGMLVFALILVFYIREFYQPGFLDYTLSHDAGRLGTVIEMHEEGWDFYLEHIFYDRYAFWTIPLFAGILAWFRINDPKQKQLLLFAIILLVGYLVSISISSTKLIWYDMPIYPVMAVISAVPLYLLVRNLSFGKPAFFSVFAIALIFFIPYRKMFFLSQGNKFAPGDTVEEVSGIFLHHQLKTGQAADLTLYHYGYSGTVLCYKYMYAERGKNLEIKYTPEFVKGEQVFVGHDSLKQVLISRYGVDTLSTFYSGILVEIQ